MRGKGAYSIGGSTKGRLEGYQVVNVACKGGIKTKCFERVQAAFTMSHDDNLLRRRCADDLPKFLCNDSAIDFN